MSPAADSTEARPSWPPRKGDKVFFKVNREIKVGILKEVRDGLVWRDFLLVDGRIIAEHKIIGCPTSITWRDPDTVSDEERRSWEKQLLTMSRADIDPHDREHELWADLTQYLAYTYLRFKRGQASPRDAA